MGCEVASRLHRFLGRHVEDLVIDGAVEYVGNEVDADSLDAVAACFAFGKQGRLCRFDGYDLHSWYPVFEHLSHAGECSAGSDARYEDVDVSAGVSQNLLR